MSTTTVAPLHALRNRKRGYILADVKVLYVSLAKNACTSLKWMVAELAGEDLSGFAGGLSNAQTPLDRIHLRGQWKHAPMVGQVDPDLQASIRPDNGWFVFAVVRDPRVRLFSAWEDKFLLRNSKFDDLSGEPWYPRYPERPEWIVEDFAKFVAMLHANPDSELFADSHFDFQTTLLAEDSVDYTRIYDIAELGELRSDLAAHLEAQGRHDLPELPHANDTPLRAVGAVFAGGVREQIEEIYARDFDRFGDRWDLSAVEARPMWSHEALAHAQAVTAMGERITELRGIGLEATARNRRLTRRVVRLEAQVARLSAASSPAPSPSVQARRLLTRVRGRLRRG